MDVSKSHDPFEPDELDADDPRAGVATAAKRPAKRKPAKPRSTARKTAAKRPAKRKPRARAS